MANVIFSEVVVFEVIPCCTCGIQFGLPDNFAQERRRTGGGFSCPNGHTLSWSDHELARTKRALAEAEQRIQREIAAKTEAQAQAAFHKSEADRAMAKAKRVEKRATAGVCPCCNRTFKQLQQHIAAKHPEVAHPSLQKAKRKDGAA